MSTTISGLYGVDKVVPDTEVQQVGVNQTWQDVKASRTSGVQETNNTGKPIKITVDALNTGSSNVDIALQIDGVEITKIYYNTSAVGVRANISEIIPSGSTYTVTVAIGAVDKWFELR